MLHRAIALYIIGTYSDNLLQNCPVKDAQKFVQKFITRYNSEDFFSPKEKEFYDNPNPSQNEIGFICWRWESLYVLLWCLGLIENIGIPKNPCEVFQCSRPFSKYRFTHDLTAAMKPRTAEEIIGKKDLVLCCMESEEKDSFDLGVITGWNNILDWILNNDKEWDVITPPPQ
ncbi:DUF4272 domain-containing protein [Histomonas meleagridis]|uniref:DUF4272 domain-containing protein n=1 Tax=Histomonas meleagridis TaxID=135588 RepID=UPI0035596C7D|nr:DUF4272 domain-containing protein [Histomonas meleagridis]KAH0802654.1 DUF4272 domain-containing protein [Histomonas meleagridis]